MPRGGFTLVELLTVIAIIAVLAALLYPVTLRAKASAQQAGNLSNLKQLGHGLALYAGDADDGIPTWSEYAYDVTNGLPAPSWGIDTPSVMWDSKLVPYVGQGNAPVDQERLSRAGVWHSPRAEEEDRHRSYGLNQMLVFEWIPASGGDFVIGRSRWRFLNLSQSDQPAQTIAIGDGGREGRLAPPRNWDAWKDKYEDKSSFYRREAPWRYDGWAGYMMLDGHVRRRRGDDLYKSPALRLPAQDLFGLNHCDMAKSFVPNEAEAEWHRSIALKQYGTSCRN